MTNFSASDRPLSPRSLLNSGLIALEASTFIQNSFILVLVSLLPSFSLDKLHNFPAEIGFKGFPATSMWKAFTALGITGRDRKKAIHVVSSDAEKATKS